MENSRLPGRIKHNIARFVDALRDIYKEGLVAVILYGSAASDDFLKGSSNVNVAVVLNDTGLDNIKKAHKVLNNNRFQSFRAYFFTEDYIKRSCDVFPIEFLDMKENYIILHGADILKDLRIDAKNLRFQCEQELKEKLLNLRKLYAENAANERALRKILFGAVSPVLHLVRNVVRLKGVEPAYAKEELLPQAAAALGIDTSSFARVLKAKSGISGLGRGETEVLFRDFAGSLEEMTYLIDRM